jgi:hypothetical protein
MKMASSRLIALTFGLLLALAATAGGAAEPAQSEPGMRSGTIDEIDFAHDSIIINDRSYHLPANAVIHVGKRQMSRQSLARGTRVEFRTPTENSQKAVLNEVWVVQ